MPKNINAHLDIVLRLAASRLGVENAAPLYRVTKADGGTSIERMMDKEKHINDVLREAIWKQYSTTDEAMEAQIAAFQEVAAVFFNEDLREL